MNRTDWIIFLGSLILAIVVVPTIVYAWSYTYDTDTPPYDQDISLGDDRIRETKDAIQERLNVDHVFGLDGSEVKHADTGKQFQVTFTDCDTALSADGGSDDTHTPAANEGILDIKDVSSTRELAFWDEASNVVQITSGGQLLLTGEYTNALTLSDPCNVVNYYTLTGTSGGTCTLPIDTTDTTEGNIRYDDTGDTVSYRTASAWSTLALATANEYACSGTGNDDDSCDGANMTIDVGFAPGFILAWSQKSSQKISWWVETDASANYYLGEAAGVNRRDSDLRISVSGTTITFYNGASDYVHQDGYACHYIALSLTAGGKNPTCP